ncbi:hypothetical protein GDO78_014891, partial [Eleutherodactylus coqui]
QAQLKKKKSFARFMKLQELRPELQGRTLEQQLELPLQRVMGYRRYLLDLVENTFPSSSDCAQLHGALRAVSDVCDHIENLQQQQDNDQQLQRVQRLLKGRRIRIASPGRLFLREGWLSLVPPSGEDVKPRMLFLFSDVLLVTAPCHPLHPFNAHKFCCRAVYPLGECHVERVLGHTTSRGGLISVRNPLLSRVVRIWGVTCPGAHPPVSKVPGSAGGITTAPPAELSPFSRWQCDCLTCTSRPGPHNQRSCPEDYGSYV